MCMKQFGVWQRYSWQDETLTPDSNPLADIGGELLHLRGQFEVGDAGQLTFAIRGLPVVYDAAKQELSCQGKTAPLEPVHGTIQLEILADRTSLEIFGNRGRIYMPIGAIAADSNRSLQLSVRGGTAKIRALEVYRLRLAWQ